MNTDHIRKYTKKIEKAKKILLNNKDDGGAVNKETIKKMLKTVSKYEIKLQNRGIDSTSAALAESETSTIVEPITVTILLFYCYVEPPWSAIQQKQMITWAEDNLSSLSVTGRLVEGGGRRSRLMHYSAYHVLFVYLLCDCFV